MSSKSRKSGASSKGHRVPDVPPRTPWYKKAWVVASAVGAVAFAVGLNGPTILQNIRKMPTEISVTSDQYLSWFKDDLDWTGNWSAFPEGIVNMVEMNLSDGVDLKLSITSKSGEIGGEISTGMICKNVPLDFLLIRGKVSGKTARITVWDFIGGRTVNFADIDLLREDGVITVKPVAGQTAWFPAGARIGKHPTSDENFMSNFCDRKSGTTQGTNGTTSKRSFKPTAVGKPPSAEQLQLSP